MHVFPLSVYFLSCLCVLSCMACWVFSDDNKDAWWCHHPTNLHPLSHGSDLHQVEKSRGAVALKLHSWRHIKQHSDVWRQMVKLRVWTNRVTVVKPWGWSAWRALNRQRRKPTSWKTKLDETSRTFFLYSPLSFTVEYFIVLVAVLQRRAPGGRWLITAG